MEKKTPFSYERNNIITHDRDATDLFKRGGVIITFRPAIAPRSQDTHTHSAAVIRGNPWPLPPGGRPHRTKPYKSNAPTALLFFHPPTPPRPPPTLLSELSFSSRIFSKTPFSTVCDSPRRDRIETFRINYTRAFLKHPYK